MKKYVYLFSEGNKDMRELLGGKGANLCEMTNLGLPVPRGFIISTEACTYYNENNKNLSDDILNQIFNNIEKLEEQTGKKFGSKINPLLVSVRSGSRASMPGMMDTILNLGLNDEIVESFSNKRFIYDSYRRFIQMYSDVVKGYDRSKFEEEIDDLKKKKNVKLDIELNEDDMKNLVERFKKIYKECSLEEFPQNPKTQLIECVKAVFNSWNNERANVYRKMNNIPYSWGTAVNVQEMVYGNLNDISGTGVAFSRNPSTGEDEFYGEYLMNAQGEDIVAGIRTPNKIGTLNEQMPEIYDEFCKYAKKLENHYKDMQDMEFTIENGKLYILQTRNGKRTAKAAVKIAVDLVKEGLISKEEAVLMVDSNSLEQLLHKKLDDNELKNNNSVSVGLPASPGAGVGKIYFNKNDLINSNEKDKVLFRIETSPEDIEAMKEANAVVTVRGGMTSHAAVVARGMGRCCVASANVLVDEENKQVKFSDGTILKEGDYVSVDGTTGNIYASKMNVIDSQIEGDFKEFMSWVDTIKRLKVFVNADTKNDAKRALELGAEGIGLTRTEHMFFEKERIFNFRKMIISNSKEERLKALEKILPYQKQDFKDLFTVMNDKKVVIRYLDPPLHEFLPKNEEEKEELANNLNITINELNERIEELKEFNPMMGHRGLRLSITYPEIAVMQTKALIEAACECMKDGITVKPHIMIPLTSLKNEYNYVKKIIINEAEKIIKSNNVDLKYKIGTMIETPRGALISESLSKNADFFSYGTNDLTQLTFGFSRDDSSKFLKSYYDKKILEFDPFERVDEVGVGSLVKFSSDLAKNTNSNIELGVCGEHAGNPLSIEFFNKLNIDYISCSPYRIPTARLAAAQAAIKTKKN